MSVERAILVTVQLDPRFFKGDSLWSLADEATELHELAISAGCQVVGQLSAKRHRPIAGTFLGSGKLQEIAEQVSKQRAQVVIMNQELSPAQQRNIEDLLEVKTIDRTQLILDIFAQRARSQEGKIQVELAQLRYLLPRLVGKGIMLSRLGGGIGTRGPGEQKLEMDRRRHREHISRLVHDLEKLDKRREAIRARRKEIGLPVAALVGYTNAGKTTLLNRLTGQIHLARNQLFTTLDPLARRIRFPNGEFVIVTDTVGFLHHLPHHLIEAFKATLEEARDADVLIHLLDVSHPLVFEHARAVSDVLSQLKLNDKPILNALNKCDQLAPDSKSESLEGLYAPAVAISAKTGQGIDRLLDRLGKQLDLSLYEPMTLRIPIERADVVANLYQSAQVLKRQVTDTTIELTVRVPTNLRPMVLAYLKGDDANDKGKIQA